ncbi:MAG TPA: S8 family serine peptidase [Phycisphaerales bacterium]|nr:S8 family serine peptidase [Phycisphaerales bacterium]
MWSVMRRPGVLVACAGVCAGMASAQVAVDFDSGPDLAPFGVVNQPLPPQHQADPAGFGDVADKNPAAALERARAAWPFRVSREEVEARMASDEADQVMLARLDARGIRMEPAERPNYYYYKGHPIAMELDTTRIALMFAEGVPQQAMSEAAVAAARTAGLAPSAAGHDVSGRWVLVKLERPLAGYEDADNRLNQFANAPGVVIASPVFHHTTMPGGYMTITPDILVRVAPGLRDKAMEVVGVKAPHLGVFNPSLANMAGAVHLRSTAKNGFDVLAEANRLSLDPAFAWAEPDIRQSMDMLYTPNDPDYPAQWQHSNDGSNGGVSDQDMDSNLGWDYTRGISGIDVLVMDNGTQSNHPDINWQAGRDFTTGAVGGVGTGDPTFACDNHGTPVAGIVAQRINNNSLGAGTCPGCNVLGAKVGDSSIQNPPCSNSWSMQGSWIANALAWGVTQGADVSNSSFSTGASNTISDAYADTALNNGVIHMAACGNGGTQNNVVYPASAPYVYGIVNLNNTGNRQPSSDWGTGTDFSAPGTSCPTTDRTGSAGYATDDNTNFSGTSCASPNAAGIAGMFRSAYPWATRSQTYAGVADGCRDRGDSGYDTEYGYGFVNSYYQVVDVNPSNDRCSGAIGVPAGTLSYSYDNLNTTWATDGWNEPQANCELNSAGEGASVWWRWTAPRSGTLDVNTNGTDYDTVLSIWNGCGQYTAAGGFDADSILACDDDSGTGTQSQILNFPVQIGETYYFKVSSYDDGTAGGLADFAFVLTPTAPANDTCASPTTIPGATYGTFAPALLDTDRATISLCEHDETCGSSNGNSNSVWYQFTPFEDGQITIDTYGSDYDTVLSIFTTSSACAVIINGNCLNGSSVACNDDSAGGLQSSIADFEVDQGETYFIKVADYNPTEGGGALDFNFVFEAPASPANDACANATVIPAGAPGGNFQDEIRAHSASTALLCEPAESCEVGAAGTGHSVWYTLTPACNGQLNLSTQGSLYDTVMSVWTECSSFTVNGCTATSQIACDDDSGAGTTSQILSLPVMAGEDYLVKISAYGTQDADRLVLNAQFMCDATPTCDSIDFNGDGLFPDTQDIADFIAVFGGAPCPTGTCGDIDFNNDGLFPDTSDISALISVFGGGPCE